MDSHLLKLDTMNKLKDWILGRKIMSNNQNFIF